MWLKRKIEVHPNKLAMPPKKKGSPPKPERRSLAASADSPAASADLQAAPAGPAAPAVPAAPAATSTHSAKVHEAIAQISGHPIFKNIASKLPLTIREGGSRAPFNQNECQQALSEGRPYQCAGNFWWHEITWMNNHRVPINSAQIQAIQRFYFPPLPPPQMPGPQT